MKQGDLILLEKPNASPPGRLIIAGSEDPWMGQVTELTTETVRFNWVVRDDGQESDGMWKIDPQNPSVGFDIWKRGKVVATIQGWDLHEKMPPTVEDEVDRVWSSFN